MDRAGNAKPVANVPLRNGGNAVAVWKTAAGIVCAAIVRKMWNLSARLAFAVRARPKPPSPRASIGSADASRGAFFCPSRPLRRKHPVTLHQARQNGAAHEFKQGDYNDKAFNSRCGRLRDVGYRGFQFLKLR
jgi:hypothetical protein